MSSSHVTSVGLYVTIFGALGVLTVATVLVASQDFGLLNTPIALGIAGLKASLVVIFFMGVRFNTPLTKVVVVGGFGWLLIMFVLTMNDYMTREWMAMVGAPGR
jgi:cytochrome c oxidase subunit 4